MKKIIYSLIILSYLVSCTPNEPTVEEVFEPMFHKAIEEDLVDPKSYKFYDLIVIDTLTNNDIRNRMKSSYVSMEEVFNVMKSDLTDSLLVDLALRIDSLPINNSIAKYRFQYRFKSKSKLGLEVLSKKLIVIDTLSNIIEIGDMDEYDEFKKK